MPDGRPDAEIAAGLYVVFGKYFRLLRPYGQDRIKLCTIDDEKRKTGRFSGDSGSMSNRVAIRNPGEFGRNPSTEIADLQESNGARMSEVRI